MLLFKLFTLQITRGQIDRLLAHTDSAFIRAIGLIYLRHSCDPKELFGWHAAARRDGRLATGMNHTVGAAGRRGGEPRALGARHASHREAAAPRMPHSAH